MLRRAPFVVVAAALLATTARAEFDAGPFPLNRGDRWVYTRQLGGEVTISIDDARTTGGQHWFRLRGFNGDQHWVRQTPTGRVYEGASSTWYRFDGAAGSGWTFRVGADAIPGSSGARVEVVSTSEAVTTPAGAFQAVHLRWRAVGVADAGITDEWFARGVGLVKRTEQSIAGPRSMVLSRASVGGRQYPTATPTPTPSPTPSPTPTVTSGAFGISGIVPASRVRLRVVLDQGLRAPAAMAYHPDGSLWIIDREASGGLIVDRPGTSTMRVTRFADDSHHFMNHPLGLAFSRSKLEFATCQESGNDYDHTAMPNMFMGPTLWTADRSIFQGGDASHLDMLHHSPFAVGIAAGARVTAGVDKREYWVFNGESGCIDRYFYNHTHELGGTDHHDGETYRYGSGLKRVAGVPGHLALDETTSILYIADTGNGRVAKLDTQAGDVAHAQPIASHHNETALLRVPGAAIQGVTPAGLLVKPAGLILSRGLIVVSDHGTGRVHVIHPDGTALGEADTGLGANAVTGLVEAPGGKLWLLDAKAGRVLELGVTN